MMNYKLFMPHSNYTFYPDNTEYNVMSFIHEVGTCYFIPKDAKMKLLKE